MEGFNGILHRRGGVSPPCCHDGRIIGRGDRAPTIQSNYQSPIPANRQPLRIQRGIILRRLGQNLIRLPDRADKGSPCRDLIPLPQGDDSVQGAGIVIVFWHIILQRGFDGGAGIDQIILEKISLC